MDILQALSDIEAHENVKIIYAVESGSRAWGFSSPDSDFDVRFVYVRPLEDYLRLEGIADFIDWPHNKILDINGWDLKKTLRQFFKSNATLFEWINSPIIYMSTPDFFWRFCREFYSRDEEQLCRKYFAEGGTENKKSTGNFFLPVIFLIVSRRV